MFELTGKTALITGASGAIGGTIARILHSQGATVAVSGTRLDALDRLAADLGDRVHVLPCNLADSAETDALVPQAEQAMGQLDILVANAGVTKDNLSRAIARRGLGPGHRRQPLGDVPPGARGGARHDAPPLRPRHRDHLGRGNDRQSGSSQLCRRQGRDRRHDQGDRAGICQARRHRELRRARLHCHADDRASSTTNNARRSLQKSRRIAQGRRKR